ncbi:MAG: hypothetical protein R3F65_25880 [bacterium]
MRARSAPFLALLMLAVAAPAAGYDAFSDSRTPARFVVAGPDGLSLVLKGDARFGLYDLEGEGGPLHDSATDTATLGTRSAFAALDRARLAFRVETGTPVAFYSALRFEATQSFVEGAWVDVRHRFGGSVGLHGELGLHTPFAATDRLTYRKPLAERIYWDQPEMHAQVTTSVARGGLGLWLGASAAMMRPLGLAAVNDASNRGGTLAVLASKQSAAFSGVEPVFGARAGASFGGVSLEGFGFLGTMAREAGIDELANTIPYYTPRERRAVILGDDRFWWAGGRLDAFVDGLELRVEGIASRESALSRCTGYVQAGYGIEGFGVFFGRFTPRVRVETYRIIDGARLRAATPSKGLTWDWDVATLAVEALVYRDVIRLHVEYSFIGEIRSGDGALPLAGLADDPYDNDELTAQIELRF